jgi:hypothetical protein
MLLCLKFKPVFIAINVAPSCEDINDELVLPELAECNSSNSKVQNTTNDYSELMVKPLKSDFALTENNGASNVP